MSVSATKQDGDITVTHQWTAGEVFMVDAYTTLASEQYDITPVIVDDAQVPFAELSQLQILRLGDKAIVRIAKERILRIKQDTGKVELKQELSEARLALEAWQSNGE